MAVTYTPILKKFKKKIKKAKMAWYQKMQVRSKNGH